MFVGHLSVALAAKRVAPTVGLGWLIAGVTAFDLLWPIFLLAGIEHVRIVPGATAFTPLVFDAYPWSHSLVMALVWGAALAGIARWRGVTAPYTTLFVGLVASHWMLDFVTHSPDMPLWPTASSPRVGLGLWNSIPLTFVVEGAMWIAGIAVYLKIAPLRGPRAQIAFWSLVLVSTAVWASGPWSPPPPDPRSLAWFAMIGWVTLPWAAAVERSRA